MWKYILKLKSFEAYDLGYKDKYQGKNKNSVTNKK